MYTCTQRVHSRVTFGLAVMLAKEEFRRNIVQFLELSDRLKDGWELQNEKNGSQESHLFLVKRNVLRVIQTASGAKPEFHHECSKTDETESHLNEGTDEKDFRDLGVSTTDGIAAGILCRFDYHVVFHPSYCVPSLYFSACHQADGKLLSLDEVWQSVPSYYQQRLESERWTFITQQEHPILGRPFYALHPCHTADLMKAVSKTDSGKPATYRNYVITWLSSVGPVVGLSLQLEYAALCSDS